MYFFTIILLLLKLLYFIVTGNNLNTKQDYGIAYSGLQ